MIDEVAEASFERFIEQHFQASAYVEIERKEAQKLADAWLAVAPSEGLEQHQTKSLGDLVEFALARMSSMKRAEERRQAVRD